MELIKSFLNLLNNTEPECFILAAYGLILIISSFIKSSYFIFSFCGTLCLAASIAIKVVNGGGIAEIFIMLFIMLAVITAAFMVTVRLTKYGWITRAPVSGGKNIGQ